MSLNEDVDLEEFIMAKDDLSGADIKAVCTEAGLLALRERRMRVTKQDFTTAREKVCDVVATQRIKTLTVITGALQEERGDTRRALSVVCFCHFRLFAMHFRYFNIGPVVNGN